MPVLHVRGMQHGHDIAVASSSLGISRAKGMPQINGGGQANSLEICTVETLHGFPPYAISGACRAYNVYLPTSFFSRQR